MTSQKEQSCIQRISKLEAQIKRRDERIAALEKQVAELLKVNAELADKVYKLSKNSSNSSNMVIRSFDSRSILTYRQLIMVASKAFAGWSLTGGSRKADVL